ncbi:MAG: dockerin type I domain-containing protein, partial [Pirellulales bacterium]
DRVTFDSAASARTVHLAGATLADFLETTTGDIVIQSMAAGPDGSVYFNNTDSEPERRGIFKLDPAGRLIKVVSHAERAATFGGSPNSSTLRMQPRTVEHPTGFPVTQLIYAEASSLSFVAGAYDFKPGDFNRDNAVDLDDLAAFAAAVGPRGGPPVSAALMKFDLNGNNVVDWKDVKILQSFIPELLDGDANMDLVIDFADLDVLRDNYYTSPIREEAASWTHGNFASLDPLATTYSAAALDANVVNLVDLEVLANTWLRVRGQPGPTIEDLDARGYTGQFRLDVMTVFAMVPEPSTTMAAAAVVAAALGLLRRRRSRPAHHVIDNSTIAIST